MKRRIGSARAGSVIVMVTVALLLMFGIVGMVVDIGLAYYYRREAQAAADAAAQAGARDAYDQGIAKGSFTSIDSSQVVNAAIKYAQINGYSGSDQGGPKVVITTGTDRTALPGDLPNLNIYYWVQARVRTQVNSLFITAAKGGPQLETGAVAIAAVLQAPLLGSVYILDRACQPGQPQSGDCTPDNAGLGDGVDVFRNGNGSITVDGGVFINSSANNNGKSGNPPGPVQGKYALEQAGGANNLPIIAPLIQFAQDGDFRGRPDPKSGLSYTNGAQVPDPTFSMNIGGKQPTVKTVDDVTSNRSLPIYGVVGSSLTGTFGPGVYVGINAPVVGQPITFTGAPVYLNNVTFTGTSSTNNTFIFLGGLAVNQATFAPGVYVTAGVSGNDPVLDLGKAVAKDNGGGQFGEMFFLTRPDYRPTTSSPELLNISSNPVFPVQPIGSDGTPFGSLRSADFTTVHSWGFGPVNMKSGQGNADLDLTGLKGRSQCDAGACPPGDAELYLYQPALMWQDRRNCVLGAAGLGADAIYTPGGACLGNNNSVKITADAASFGGLKGLIYQPRGAVFELQGNGTKQDATTIITGALSLGGGPNITLTPNPTSTNQIIVSLIR